MKLKAVYLGCQDVDRKEREVNGIKYEAFKGFDHIFAVGEWDGEYITEYARQYRDRDETQLNLKIGDKVLVEIRASDLNQNYWCTYIEESKWE